jgi:hypothetical protein
MPVLHRTKRRSEMSKEICKECNGKGGDMEGVNGGI